MSDPQSYSELVSTLANWINRTDLTETEIPMAISMAERRFNRVLRVPEMEEVVQATTIGGTITLPDDILQVRAVYLATDPKATLEQMTHAELRNRFSASASGLPSCYALQSGSEIVFGPSPDSEYPIVLNYYAKIPALGTSQATNWLLARHADIYIFGALAELSDFMKDEGRADRYEGKVAGRIAELNAEARSKAYGGAPLRMRSAYNL